MMQIQTMEASELAALIAAGAIPEKSQADVEARLSTDALLRAELANLSPVIETFCDQTSTPPTSIRAALLERLEREPRTESANPQIWKRWTRDDENRKLLIRRSEEGAWEETGVEGVRVKRLLMDQTRNQFTALVRMAPGSSYPRHVHNSAEECLVLEGDIRMGDHVLRAGDYQYAPSDSLHGVQSTEGGCLLLISSGMDDDLI